ncbi:MAG: hypothetical protein C4294_14035 [Nitrospiraceae bacterium]
MPAEGEAQGAKRAQNHAGEDRTATRRAGWGISGHRRTKRLSPNSPVLHQSRSLDAITLKGREGFLATRAGSIGCRRVWSGGSQKIGRRRKARTPVESDYRRAVAMLR